MKKVYDILWSMLIYSSLLLIYVESDIFKKEFNIVGALLLVVFLFGFISLICIVIYKIIELIKSNLLDKPIVEVDLENWIYANKIKLNNNYSEEEKKQILGGETYKIRDFWRYMDFGISVKKYLIFSALVLLNVFSSTLSLKSAIIILLATYALEKKVNRVVVRYTIFFVIKKFFSNQEYTDNDKEPELLNIKNENIQLTTGPLKLGCPPIDLLGKEIKRIDINQANEMKQKLEFVLKQFELDFLQIKGLEVGASITRFIFKMDASGRIGAVTKVQNELSMQLGVESIRVSTSSNGLVFEIPNKNRSSISYRECLELYRSSKGDILEVPIGKFAVGGILTLKINELPHLLIAGGTGSGKSVCINTIIVSLLYNCTPDQVKFIFIDPKVVELKCYEGIPHMLMPVINDPIEADKALKWAVREMEERYKKFASTGVRNIKAYYEKHPSGEMPYLVIVIDELADLMAVAKSSKEIDIENSICRLGQMARAAGIHLIIGTQRPSAEVITGLIKANIPARIGFSLPSQVDSRTIIDTSGAEKLLGKGDGLLVTTETREPVRFQGAFLEDAEINRVVEWWKLNSLPYKQEVLEVLNQIETGTELSDQPEPESKSEEQQNELEIKLLVMLADYAYGLEREYEKEGQEKEIELPWNREKIREMLACGKASLQEVLKNLTSQGVIESVGAGRGAKTYFKLSDEECYELLKKYAPEVLNKYQ